MGKNNEIPIETRIAGLPQWARVYIIELQLSRDDWKALAGEAIDAAKQGLKISEDLARKVVDDL